MRRTGLGIGILVLTIVFETPSSVVAQPSPGTNPVIFVHGMGGNAKDIGTAQFADLLQEISRAHPAPGVCQEEAQSGRPWDGSPCVFRFVEDMAEADGGPNDSQSAVAENAEKLAREVGEVYDTTGGRRIVLIGYSMGGAIIRTYLAKHRADAAKRIGSVVLIDPVASGSWGYAFTDAVPRRLDGPLGTKLTEVMRSLAATTSAVDFDRPATRDLSPRSALFRQIAAMALPTNIDYYTFWGDIRISIERRLLTYDLPDFRLPPIGDLGLLPGDPDPTVLPELGGQRFSPRVDEDRHSLDVPHRTSIALQADTIGDLISRCGHKPADGGRSCKALVAEHFDIPNTHTAIPTQMAGVMVDEPLLGGRVSLLDAVLAAVTRGMAR